ncbi:hypothetical protein DFQ28_007319 [Apophysomyces sp. BC1034]|nr:hypothetical protein DFQ30_007186 [Apophysomyces sp. BC1015]KAG0176349.1 hypothetical protein DFQ29_006225 [Apophysomyces sp. BC1021]KAG0186765.1 hypothetical protein DFQ28_007319 [Apophysomyces sp. BC1034]
MTGKFQATDSVQGQIRHRRKLGKRLFFIDLQPLEGDKVQILFRCDDHSVDPLDLQDLYRDARPGHVVRVDIGPTADPEEDTKPYKVWQSNALIVLEPYSLDGQTFVMDKPLGADKVRKTIRQWDGSHKNKSDMYCKYWLNQRTCLHIDTCPFQHPTEEEFKKARETWVEERLAIRRITTHDPNDPHQSKKPHALRAMVFAEWIKNTFFDRSDSSLPTVLDVAGGKGELAMFLSRGFGIPAVVVEPKIRKRPDYWYTRLQRLMAKHDEGGPGQGLTWPSPVEPTYLHRMLDGAFLSDHAELLQNVSLLAGLHADQATEPIVDVALQLGKPFAVVPCCVFGHENRSRRLSTGEPVLTTEDLVQYLCEKDTSGRGHVQKAYLDFEGKNVVVYWIPSS